MPGWLFLRASVLEEGGSRVEVRLAKVALVRHPSGFAGFTRQKYKLRKIIRKKFHLSTASSEHLYILLSIMIQNILAF